MVAADASAPGTEGFHSGIRSGGFVPGSMEPPGVPVGGWIKPLRLEPSFVRRVPSRTMRQSIPLIQTSRTLRRRRYATMKKDETSERLMPHTAPRNPKAHVAGIPTISDMTVALQKAKKIESGDSMARNTTEEP